MKREAIPKKDKPSQRGSAGGSFSIRGKKGGFQETELFGHRGIGFSEPCVRWPAVSAFGGGRSKIFSGKRTFERVGDSLSKGPSLDAFRSPFSGRSLRLVLVDRVLPKVISEIKNGWLRIEQM